jgi:hypothetical protein
MKKAQLEVLGLAVIVLLLSLGMLMVFKFIVTQEPIDTKQSVTEKQQSSNFLGAILETSTGPDCRNMKIKELFADCADCFDSADYCQYCELDEFNPLDSCTYLENILGYALNETFGRDDDLYNIEAFFIEGSTILQINNTICSGAKTGEEYLIPVGSRTLFVTFDICR